MKRLDSGNFLTVPLLSVVILLVLSLFDWERLSGNRLNSFNLFEDLLVEPHDDVPDTIDPLLAAALEEVTDDEDMPSTEFVKEPEAGVEIVDTISVDQMTVPEFVIEKIDGIQPFEDYTKDGSGLQRFAAAITQTQQRIVRVAVIGDSYIEGDIFTQDIRRLLQREYGGGGVGYMSMHSDFPGFRRSITQSDHGWTVVDMRNASQDSIRTLAGDYCVASDESATTFRASKNGNGAWGQSTVVYFSSAMSGTLKLKTTNNEQTVEVMPSEKVQSAAVEGETTQLTVTAALPGLKILGAWLDNATGISVDCMSLRGNSGVTHRSINVALARDMSSVIDYDLLVVEFGMNVASAEQTEYSSYSNVMSKVIKRLRLCYPNADIVLLGVGDRGEKNGTTFQSMSTLSALTRAQRDCARREGVVFWDTRAAMGGAGSILDWRNRGLVNADYVHLNHKGGAELAEQFVDALKLKLRQ